MGVDGLRQRTENNTGFFELVFEGGDHRDTVEHRIHGNPGQHLLFQERNAQFVVSLQ